MSFLLQNSEHFPSVLGSKTVRGADEQESMTGIFYSPSQPVHQGTILDVAQVEELLGGWFGNEVVLLSSGRAAIRIFFALMGFGRYSHRIAIPQYMSRCVVNAVNAQATACLMTDAVRFDGELHYHQYGFSQAAAPIGMCLEDVCHAFFSSAKSGDRSWRGSAAAFSLPKFFSIKGPCGGLICLDSGLAKAARDYRDGSPQLSPERRGQVSKAVCCLHSSPAAPRHAAELEAAYETLLWDVRPYAEALVGLPATLEGLGAIGGARQTLVEIFRGHLSEWALPMLRPPVGSVLPYALPVFADEVGIARVTAIAAAHRMEARAYMLDVARDARQPEYRKAVLLPAHQEIDPAAFDAMCGAIRGALA